jgi:CRISPR/Cas system-associated endoribonuclease Cas2
VPILAPLYELGAEFGLRRELSEAQVERVKIGLKDLIDEDRDSVYIYILRDARWVKKEVLGQVKGETGNVV